jgi:hypothetical protein
MTLHYVQQSRSPKLDDGRSSAFLLLTGIQEFPDTCSSHYPLYGLLFITHLFPFLRSFLFYSFNPHAPRSVSYTLKIHYSSLLFNVKVGIIFLVFATKEIESSRYHFATSLSPTSNPTLHPALSSAFAFTL